MVCGVLWMNVGSVRWPVRTVTRGAASQNVRWMSSAPSSCCRTLYLTPSLVYFTLVDGNTDSTMFLGRLSDVAWAMRVFNCSVRPSHGCISITKTPLFITVDSFMQLSVRFTCNRWSPMGIRHRRGGWIQEQYMVATLINVEDKIQDVSKSN